MKEMLKITKKTMETYDYISHDNPCFIDDSISSDQLTEQHLRNDERPQKGQHYMQSHSEG